MDTRRLLLAFVLSLAVILVWYTFFPPPKPLPATPPAPQRRAAPVPGPAETAAPGGPAAPAAPAASAPPQSLVEATVEEQVVLQQGRLRAVVTNRGAQLISMQVPEKSSPGSGTLEMVRKRIGWPYPYALTGARGLAPHPLNQALFQAERGADGRSAVFRYSGSLGVAEKRFRFDDSGLLEVEIRLPGRADWGVLLGPGIRSLTAEEMKARFERRRAIYKAAGKVEGIDAQRAAAAVDVSGRSVGWIGLADTYYLAAQIPKVPLDRAVLVPVLVEPGGDGARVTSLPAEDQITKEQKALPREFVLVMRPEGDRVSLVSFWGAKEFERLKALPYGLEGAVELGYFGFLARPLLVGLHWIHDHLVPNYGWAIVLMTVLLKLVLLPVTHRSTMSMRKMQALNPRVQAIRDRYRTKLRDKQGKPNLESQRKMNEEVMGVYKEAGVNPASGCFPLLLQMPILWAFYSLLSTAVDLRKAPWMFWIKDLSVQDPYLVLPIIMGITQFVQARLGPQAADPMQRRMFQLMPLFMTVIFVNFPSGLVLYWLTNNVLTILQLQIYNRMQKGQA